MPNERRPSPSVAPIRSAPTNASLAESCQTVFANHPCCRDPPSSGAAAAGACIIVTDIYKDLIPTIFPEHIEVKWKWMVPAVSFRYSGLKQTRKENAFLFLELKSPVHRDAGEERKKGEKARKELPTVGFRYILFEFKFGMPQLHSKRIYIYTIVVLAVLLCISLACCDTCLNLISHTILKFALQSLCVSHFFLYIGIIS